MRVTSNALLFEVTSPALVVMHQISAPAYPVSFFAHPALARISARFANYLLLLE